jgi:hypothetical protein
MIGVPSQPKHSKIITLATIITNKEQKKQSMQIIPIARIYFCFGSFFHLLPVRHLLTSTYRSTQGLSKAHASKPPVAKMKMKTTASSFRESRSMHNRFG